MGVWWRCMCVRESVYVGVCVFGDCMCRSVFVCGNVCVGLWGLGMKCGRKWIWRGRECEEEEREVN